MYTCIYVYMYKEREREIDRKMDIYIYREREIHIYIYMYRERDVCVNIWGQVGNFASQDFGICLLDFCESLAEICGGCHFPL